MSFKHLTYETNGRIATITLNRPDRLNAIARGMPQEIREAVEKANDDNAVHAIVLTGAGRAFCGGLDLKELGAGQGSLGRGDARGARPHPVAAMERFAGPIIGAINGPAVTGGFELALPWRRAAGPDCPQVWYQNA